jgi:hypothetical protein
MATKPVSTAIPQIPIEKDWKQRVRAIPIRAAAVGLSMAEICRSTGLARATPDRWRVRAPKTIEAMAKIEALLAAAEQKAAKASGKK